MFRGEDERRRAYLAVLAVGALLLAAPSAGAKVGEGVAIPPDRVPVAKSSPARAAPADALDRALRRGDITRARYALARAQALFRIARVRHRYGAVRAPGPQEATPVLQQLDSRLDRLPPRARRRAVALFRRPPDGANDQFGDGYTVPSVNQCFTPAGAPRALCVHWVTSTADAPPLTDTTPVNGIPDQVDRTITTLGNVWAVEIDGMDYRLPLADSQGPNNGTDIYLADLGDDGLFGYCAADPSVPDSALRAPAYCVIDNDFSAAQYEPPAPSGLPALQITLAHEFFHAIQFAYEFSDKDQWLKEGTAAWIEDEVYDAVNANRSYLSESHLQQPEIPLDHAGLPTDAQDFEYGAWVFWRFLSEYVGADTIRQVWEATAPTTSSDPSALTALNAVVAGLVPNPANVVFPGPTTLRRAFAEYALWNLLYDDPFFYEEGPEWFLALHQRHPPYDGLYLMDDEYFDTGSRGVELDGLAQGHVTFRVHPALAEDFTLTVFSFGSQFDGALEVTALVERVGATQLEAFDMTSGNSGFGFDNAEAITLVYSNAAASPDEQLYQYQAFLEPDSP